MSIKGAVGVASRLCLGQSVDLSSINLESCILDLQCEADSTYILLIAKNKNKHYIMKMNYLAPPPTSYCYDAKLPIITTMVERMAGKASG